jgi:hypothetical protein
LSLSGFAGSFYLEVVFCFFGSFPGGYLRDLLGIFLGILADLTDQHIMAQGKYG